MKRFLKQAILAAIPLFLAACTPDPKPTAKDLEQVLSLNLEGATKLSAFDNHGGVHGDGISCIVLDCKQQDLLKQLQQNKRWKPLPLDKTAHTILREHDFTGMGLDLKKAIPEIKEGFYLIRDRHPLKHDQPDLLKRDSLNLTIVLYDTQNKTLYAVNIDT